MKNWFRQDSKREKFEFYDPLAVALALEPSLASVLNVTLAVGSTVCEDWGETKVISGTGRVALASEVEAGRFFGLLRETLSWEGL